MPTKPKRLRGPYRRPADLASDNTFQLEGPRGGRKSKPACLNGSWRLRKGRPITLAQHASFSGMSLEELREYNRAAQQRCRAGGRSKPRPQQAAERKRLVTNKELTGEDVIPAFRPTPEMIADAHRRYAAPRPITAWLMGDPPPGTSALDRRRSSGQP